MMTNIETIYSNLGNRVHPINKSATINGTDEHGNDVLNELIKSGEVSKVQIPISPALVHNRRQSFNGYMLVHSYNSTREK